MKRLLEWKQRMLQSPLTRKNNSSGSGARSSERSTPTLTEQDTTPRIINRAASPVQQGESINSFFSTGRFSRLNASIVL